MERMGHVIHLKGDIIDEYKRIHREVWPAVLKGIAVCALSTLVISSGAPAVVGQTPSPS